MMTNEEIELCRTLSRIASALERIADSLEMDEFNRINEENTKKIGKKIHRNEHKRKMVRKNVKHD